jgi:signal transduction histidine kinase
MMNSVKHHDRDHGKVTIQAEIFNNMVSVTVLDDGPGFPLEFNKKAFQLFQTMKRRDEVEGSGMGLALARKTMQSLDGSIDVLPRKGRGCCLRLQWPHHHQIQPMKLKLVAENIS